MTEYGINVIILTNVRNSNVTGRIQMSNPKTMEVKMKSKVLA